MPLRRGFDDGSDDTSGETEGHRKRAPDDEIVDAEAHRFTFNLDDGSNGDAEGHGYIPTSAFEREGGGRPKPAERSRDDVEGHVNFRPLDNRGER